jgi:hypothetical protein
MRKLTAGILVLLVTCGITACGYKDGVENIDSRAYLYFTGYTKQAEVLVDDVPLDLGKHVTANDHYQIQPGQHLVEVKHHGQSIVRRQIYVTEGAAKEIPIPNP